MQLQECLQIFNLIFLLINISYDNSGSVKPVKQLNKLRLPYFNAVSYFTSFIELSFFVVVVFVFC